MADPVEDHVRASRGQQPQIDTDLVGGADRLQIGPHPGLIGDDPCVLRVGLAVAPVGRRGVVKDPAWKVEHALPPVGQQRQQQRRPAGVEIGGPHRLVLLGQRGHGGDQAAQGGLVVGHPPREQHPTGRVDDDAVVRPFP